MSIEQRFVASIEDALEFIQRSWDSNEADADLAEQAENAQVELGEVQKEMEACKEEVKALEKEVAELKEATKEVEELRELRDSLVMMRANEHKNALLDMLGPMDDLEAQILVEMAKGMGL